jgi:hypothetical protein
VIFSLAGVTAAFNSDPLIAVASGLAFLFVVYQLARGRY